LGSKTYIKYRPVGKVTNSNRKIIKTGKIVTLYTQIHDDRSLSWLLTNISIKTKVRKKRGVS
jgi:hypothetical protein